MINLIYTLLCIFCLCIGFFYGLKIGKEEKIKTPIEKINEIKNQKETRRFEKQEKEHIEKLNTILSNIDSYDGSVENQKEV